MPKQAQQERRRVLRPARRRALERRRQQEHAALGTPSDGRTTCSAPSAAGTSRPTSCTASRSRPAPTATASWFDAGEIERSWLTDKDRLPDHGRRDERPRQEPVPRTTTDPPHSDRTPASPRRPAPHPFPGERPVTPEVVREHNLNELEYDRIVAHAGPRRRRSPSSGIFSALWSEHCSYKHSKPVLKTLPDRRARRWCRARARTPACSGCPTGWAVAFKIESHNHPSAVEPYQGAATGVGGILRDVFTMGARPVAMLNSLRFGPLDAAAQPLPLRRRREGRRRLRQLRRRPDARRRGGLRPGLHRQSAGQRDVRRPAARGGPDPRARRTASATSCSRSARAPGATAFTARASPPRSSPRRARPGGRRCRSAIRSPRSCCSRRASS